MRRPILTSVRKTFPIALALMLLAGVAGCNEPAAETTSETGQTALTVSQDTQTKTFTMAQLKQLKASDGYGGIINSVGTITAPSKIKGVSITELLSQVGGLKETDAIKVEAKDGYTMTFSYAQITRGEFTTLDAKTGKEVARGTLVPLVIYEEDGKPLSDSLGPLRLGIISGQDKVTEGHWWVKWVTKISVAQAQQPWSLKLTGKLTEEVVSTTFQSCAAPNCHGASWKDDQNREWQGVPLWLLLGRVDDDNSHKAAAFSVDLATKGYQVVVTATDGFKQTFSSADVKNNKDMIVAYQRDGQAVPENQWPLRLVGPNISKQQMVGKVASVSIDFSAAPATTTPQATTTAAGPTVLTVTKGTQAKTFTVSALKSMSPASGYGGQKSKSGAVSGPSQFKGVSLADLLATVGGIAESNSVKVTAKDGFSKTLTYSQVTQGGFVTFDKTGTEVAAETKPVLFVAYEKDGAALDDSTGPVQLGLLTSQNQVTEGTWWVKATEKIEVITAQ